MSPSSRAPHVSHGEQTPYSILIKDVARNSKILKVILNINHGSDELLYEK